MADSTAEIRSMLLDGRVAEVCATIENAEGTLATGDGAQLPAHVVAHRACVNLVAELDAAVRVARAEAFENSSAANAAVTVCAVFHFLRGCFFALY